VINQKIAELILKDTGLTPAQISRMDHEEVTRIVERHTGHKITEYALGPGLSSGNILIDMGRVITSEEIQRRANKIGRSV